MSDYSILYNKSKADLDKIFEGVTVKEDLKRFFSSFSSVDELTAKCILWGQVFLPKYFTAKTPDFHFGIVKKFFSMKNEYSAYPRGFGKTTLIQLCISFSVVNSMDEFILVVEKSFSEAAEVLEAVREEFTHNELIVDVYGELMKVTTRGVKDEKAKSAEGDFFVNGVRLRGKGFDAPIRGIKSRHTRPTKIVLDDVESDEHIDNPVQRRKYLNNYIKGIIPAVSPEGGNLKVFGTILHDDSLLNTLIKTHQGEIFRAWDKDRKLLWGDFWTVERLEEKRADMSIEGKSDAAFYQEYFNEPVSEEDQIFKQTHFRYYNDFQLKEIMKREHKVYLLLDPAISKKESADFTAIIALLTNAFNDIYVLEIMRARMDPYETAKGLFAMYERWQPFKVGIEAVIYQKSLIYIINEERRRVGSSLFGMNIVEIKADQDKILKIKTLQPRYERGQVYHRQNDPMTRVLEDELTRFPRGATDDVIDALSGIEQILVPIRRPLKDGYNKFMKEKKRWRHVSY